MALVKAMRHVSYMRKGGKPLKKTIRYPFFIEKKVKTKGKGKTKEEEEEGKRGVLLVSADILNHC